jgi:outer membrane protein assembly factor BamA
MIRIALVLVCVGASVAQAQIVDPAKCLDLDTTPGAVLEPAPPADQVETPIPWTDFVVEGTLVDPVGTVHAMLAPTLEGYRTSLTATNLREVAKVTAKLGYQLVHHEMRGLTLVLRLGPLPMVRKVDVRVDQGWFDRLLDDEVRRRMLVRVGSYLPFDPLTRDCALQDERLRIEEYLHDEGFPDPTVKVLPSFDEDAVTILVKVELGAEYRLARGEPQVILPPGFVAITPAEIKPLFEHRRICFIAACFGTEQFTRSQHQDDLQKVRELFHRNGYFAARVVSSFDPKTSFDRRTKSVHVTLTIDPRRKLDLRFEGIDSATVDDDNLRKHLTFEDAGSTDDVEAANSARSLQTYLQQRGRFDARVTWSRDRFDEFDRITFHILQGPTRLVRQVQFVCDGRTCEKHRDPFDSETLAGIVATKTEDFTGDLLGTNVSATSPELATDVDRIREAYRRVGYREAEISVTASTIPMPPAEVFPPSAALTAALVEENASDSLHVRFAIDQGEPTMLARVELEGGDTGAKQALAGGLCDELLRELAGELRAPQLARRADPNRCAAVVAKLPFREDDVSLTHDRLRDVLFKQGRPNAIVDYEARVLGARTVEAHYTLHSIDERRIGKIVVRGNFRTMPAVIYDRLGLHEGQLLTSDALAEAARRLRNTGLFEAVNVDFIDKDSDAGEINAVVRIEERYDQTAQLDFQVGGSTYNGVFATVTGAMRNILGTGAVLTATVTRGDKIQDYESKLIIPKWLTHICLPGTNQCGQADITGLYLNQDTPRFGWLTTEGVTTGLTFLDSYPRTTRHDAWAWSFGVHYDYRLRTRNIDALRPIGADMDDPQVAVSTETGSVAATFDLDHRNDRNGQLAPLAPERGYHLFGQFAYAMPDTLPVLSTLGGQFTFIKLSASGSYFHLFGKNLVVRGDLRYDEGFPLGGAALLPEVERFFAGGDNTVRGYADDRLATEIIQVGVPPLSNVSQIRVIPAGGDIRVLGSLDAQYHIAWIMAGALFTDAGLVANQWRLVRTDDIRPSTGVGLRFLSPFGIAAVEYAVPLAPHLGDDPRGRYHLYFAARAQF